MGDPAGGGAQGRGSDRELEARYRSTSLWMGALEGSLLAPRPPLEGEADCDVAIVGAGFTGLWTAYYLKTLQPDLRIAVIEREIAGYGASGRNGGWAIAGLAGSPSAYGCAGDAERIGRALRCTVRAIDEIGAVIDHEQIDCGFVKAGALTVATSGPQWQRLASHDSTNAGASREQPDGELLSAAEAEAFARVPGLRGGRYCTPRGSTRRGAGAGLASACERHGVTIHERSDATAIEPGRVRTGAGEVRAEIVIRATESYTTQLPGSRLRYLPLYSLMIATAPLDDRTWEALGWHDGLLIDDRHHLFFYAQRTPDGRIAIGGRGAPYRLRSPIDPRNERSERVRARLVATLRAASPPRRQPR